ncbi:MAG: hypothetical protein F4Z85_10090 [Gemmatimonadetes bacterium]|nr:hypothetical protein [Gemmatimonadota bacterium]MYB70735.1 hypothetical protein [Gemmatimonadota bacterium]
MPIRLALLAFAVALWSCGDDDAAPTAAAVDSMIATADSMLVAANTMMATADSMITAANAMVAADADSTIAADAAAMLAAANDMMTTANSMVVAANAMVAADADSTIAADAASMLAAANTMIAAADSMLASAGSILAPEAVVRPTGELKPWDLSVIVTADEVRAMPPGTTVFMRTEFANGELADLEMTFVQVVDDFLPPMPIYMFEASDPALIQIGGVAQGMSGSPVFTEQGTWGAIGYGFNGQTSPPYYGFATPIEWVIGTEGLVPAAKPTATWEGYSISPLEIPLLNTGLNGVRRLPEGRSSLLSKTVAAGLTQERQASFEAGRPLTVGLLLGELTLGALGTISYVDGNRVYGFGHPMNSSGPVELPIIEAKVLGEVSNLSSPFKYGTLNPTVRGTLTEDRLPAVRGVLDQEPDLVPIKSVYTFPSGSELELTHRMAVGISPYASLDLVANAFFAPLVNRVDNDPEHSIRVTADIAFTGSDSTLTRSRLYSSPGGRLLASIYDAYGDVSFALEELMTRNDYAVHVREAEVQVAVIPGTRFATIAKVTADSVVSLGSALNITTALRVGRTEDREIALALSVPDTLWPGFYQLEVGSAATLGDDALLFGPPPGYFEDEESLDDVFARLNKPDENVLLKARLTFLAPPEPELPPEFEAEEGEGMPEEGETEGEAGDGEGEEPESEGDPEGENGEGEGEGESEGGEGEEGYDGHLPLEALPPGPPPAPPAPISTQQDVDLLLQGIQFLEVEVVVGEEEVIEE